MLTSINFHSVYIFEVNIYNIFMYVCRPKLTLKKKRKTITLQFIYLFVCLYLFIFFFF